MVKRKPFPPKPKCEKGVLEGKKLLNDQFTFTAFEDLLGRYKVIHIASHFKMNPGNERDSFLLLGGGDQRRFTVGNLRQVSLKDVELVVLSACDTATPGKRANGLEIEAFGSVARNQGAKAVLGTLWAVDDTSTRDLMVDFYKIYDENQGRGKNKAEALKEAQLKMLHGAQPSGGLTRVIAGMDGKAAPFRKHPGARYAHPYFWSPFVLMGNWK